MRKPDRLAGIDEPVEGVHQNRSLERGDVLLERVELARVEHGDDTPIPARRRSAGAILVTILSHEARSVRAVGLP